MELIYSSGSFVYTGTEFSGIYGWKCHKTSKWNVGESIAVLDRTRDYFKPSGIKGQIIMLHARKKYGMNEFTCYKLEECKIEQLHDREVYWSEQLNSMYPNGYNLRVGGDGKALVSEETRMRISKANTGKVCKEHVKQAARIANIGKKVTKETKEKLRLAAYKQFADKGHPCKGKKHDSDRIEKNRLSHIGKVASPETKKKMSEMRTGKNNPFYGKKLTEEHKAKMNNARRLNKLIKWLEKEAPWFCETQQLNNEVTY
jgi:group I intron endonuclease